MNPQSPRGEFEWIDRLVEILASVGATDDVGAIGDDAAVLVGPTGETWVWTVDTLVEGIHFRFDWLAPESVGHRALAASLSDVAAMAAEPIGALVTVAATPAGIDAHIEGIYRGIARLAAETSCPILGGDLTRSPNSTSLTVTALGRVPSGEPLCRDGAQPGDEVWVTGRLGGPAAALSRLRDSGGAAADPDDPAFVRLAHPQPRLAEIRWLADRVPINAAIDVSDGVSGDAGHLAKQSGVEIVLQLDDIPLHPRAADLARELGVEPIEWALHGGEEFELLMTVPAGELEPHREAFGHRFGEPLTKVGTVDKGKGVWTQDGESRQKLEPGSWDHFAESGR